MFHPPFSILLLCLAATFAFTSCRTAPPKEPPPALQISGLDPGAPAPAKPEILAPGVISTANGERDAAFLPDYSAFYYTLWTGRFGVILEMKRSDAGWSSPEVASFSGRYSDIEPFVSPDGRRLYFSSNRPLEAGGETKDYDIWYARRSEKTWSSPVRLDSTVNTPANEFYPSLDQEGTLYFTASYEHSLGGEDIWFSRSVDDHFVRPENAGPAVNTERDEFNALIAPDGSFLVFSSFGRDDGLGGGDLYVSFRLEDGALDRALNAGAPINSEALDFSPALTPDGHTFLFSSRRSGIPAIASVPRTYRDLTRALDSPGNGDLDLYLVNASFLDSLGSIQ